MQERRRRVVGVARGVAFENRAKKTTLQHGTRSHTRERQAGPALFAQWIGYFRDEAGMLRGFDACGVGVARG